MNLISVGISLTHCYAFSPWCAWSNRQGCPSCGPWVTSGSSMTFVTLCQVSVMADGQLAPWAGVYKLNQILGWGRKSGRAAKAGSSPIHWATRPESLPWLWNVAGVLSMVATPCSLPLSSSQRFWKATHRTGEVGGEPQSPKNMDNCL